MEDTFENLSIDYASIKVVTDPEGREQEVSYDFSGNTGYYTVPDETKVIITYKARISPPEGTQWTQDGDTQVAEVEVTNVASMLTWQDGGTNTLEVRRDAGADIYRIRAFKYGSGHMEDGLNGAVFGLYQDKMDDSGNPVQQKDENGAPVVDSWGNSVYEKEAISRTKGSLAGSPITFATRDVWMLDGLIQSELTGMSAESVSSLTDDELLKKLLGNYDEFNIADARAELRNLSGYADVQLSDDADGVHLQQGKTYYLKELTEPTGYAKDTSVEYYAFRFGEDAMYVNGVWQYYNSDILKIRNSPTDGAFTLRKKLEGNYALSDEQKDALRFAVYKLVGSSWERVEVEVPATDGTGNTTYKKVAELTYDQLRDGLSVTHIGAGTFRIIESMAARGEDVPGSVSHTVSFTRDGIEDDMTEDGGKQYAQFEITDDDILNGLEHTFEITNIYTQETVTFNTRKAWSDAEGNPVTPSGAKVTFGVFSLTDGALSETALPVQTVTLDGIPDVNTAAVSGESAAWIAQFARLPKLDDAGIEITYVVKEISGITGYEAIYGNEDGYLSFKDGENVIVPIITNKQETVEYTVNKQWTKPFWENESWTAPSGVKLGVYYGTTETEAYAKYTSGQRAYREITLPAEGADPEAAWEANFTDLPKSDGTGKEYQWIAVETVCPVGFVAEYPNGGDYLSLTGNSDEALTVMNRVEGVDVSFTKAWQRTLNNEWPEGQSIEVTLTRTLKGGDEASDDAFTAVYTIIRSGDELSATLTTGKAPTDWNNNEVTPVISVDGKTGRASFILKGLPRYGTVDGNNGEWEYRFAESELSDYATTYSTGASYAYALNGGVITNTQKDAEISFKKTWIGEDGQSESWAEGTTITVRRIQQFKYLDGVEEKTETIGTIEFKIEKTSDGFNIEPSEGLVFDEEKVRFTSGTYPKYGVRSGHTGEYIFTWEETAVTDSNGDELSYVPVVNMDAADSGQTNIVNIKLKTVDAKVDKTWLDGENSVPDALKAPVRVRLYHKVDAPADGDDYIEVNSSRYVPVIQDAMGVAIDAIELSADNGWTATVPLLSKYVSNGADAAEEVYIFREEAVYLDGAWTNDVEAYYTVENTDTETAPYGTVINNKPKDTLTKTSVFVSKTWADSGDHSQDEVTVRLYQAIDIPADADVMNINVRTEWYYVDSNGELIPAPPLNKSTYSTMTDNVGGHVNFYVNAYKGSPIWGLYLIDSSNLFDSYGNTQVGGKIIVIEDPDLIEFTKGETSVTGADDITLRASLSSNWEKYISIPEETKASWPYYKIGQTSGVYNYRFIVKYKEEAPERKSADTLRLLSPDEGIASIPDNAVQTDSVLVLKNGSWSGSFNDLPTTIGGYPVTYYVVEETVKTKAAAVSVAYAHNGNAWTITNTAEYNEPTTDFEFTKVWYDNDGKEVDWQDNISVSLFSSTVEGEDTKIATFNLSSDGGTSGAFTWSAEKIQNDAQKINRTKFKIEGLPAKADGATLTYYVTEAKIEGYKDPVYGTSAGTENNVITLKTDAKAESGQYIQNIPEDAYVLPSTGGIGSGAYRILGTFMTLYAALLLARRRKKRNGE
ncbi:MAG: Cna B-type domain-containing protein [Clostridia bacterium]|nr:Cna B-type domain-containing protein [Clostridia bacterium]